MIFEERLALNQAIFRAANERIRAWADQPGDQDRESLSVFCECSHEACRKKIAVERDEYEAVRSNSLHFLVSPGHNVSKLERMVRECDRYAVVEKLGEVAALVTATDPRRSLHRR